LIYIVGLVFNFFGEEIYYRGLLLPKTHGVFGTWDWVAHNVLFTHISTLAVSGNLGGWLGIRFCGRTFE